MNDSFKVKKGLNISSGGTGTATGDITANSNKLEHHNGTTSSPLVTEAHAAILTNKTLSGNTATNLVSGAGAFTFNTSGTVTAPNATDTLVGKATTDVLTNKTLDADVNTISNLVNASIKAGAAIAYNKLAALTASRALTSDGSGVVSVSAVTSTELGRLSGILSSAVGISDTQVLTNKDVDGGTASNSNRITLPKNTAANLTALTRKEGTVVYATDQQKALLDNGTTLVSIGSGSGAINYISGGDAENGNSSRTTYADAAANPVDGTGGSPTATFVTSTSSPLRGTNSWIFTRGTLGDGAAFAFTIDSADKGKVLSIGLDYEVASGTYATGDLTVWIYDVTNSVMIQPAPYQILNAVGPARFQAAFQTASNSTSYRLLIHQATTGVAYTVKMDGISVGPQTLSQGTPVTDWTSYTPTFSGLGSGRTDTVLAGFYRRVGDSIEVAALWRGTTGSGTSDVTVTIPSFVTLDPTVFNNNSSQDAGLDGYLAVDTANFGAPSAIIYNGSNTFLARSAGTGSNVVGASATKVRFYAKLKVSGWASNIQMSSETDTRIVAYRSNSTPTSATFNNGSYIIFPTALYDTHTGMNANGRFYAPVSGYYHFSGQFIISGSSAGSFLDLNFFKSGVSTQQFAVSTLATGEQAVPFNVTVFLNAGEDGGFVWNTNKSSPAVSGGSTKNTLNIERVSGPAQIAVTELIAADMKYGTGALTGLTNATMNLVNITTTNYDTHGAVNAASDRFTAPASGIYRMSLYARMQGAAINIEGWVRKNGATDSRVGSVVGTVGDGGFNFGSYTLSLNAGDYVQMYIYPNGSGASYDQPTGMQIERLK